MFDLHEVYEEYMKDYATKKGHAPCDTLIRCSKLIVTVSEEFYKLGKQDAASGKKLSDNELFALAASKFAGDPELNELTTKLLCGCYRDGWNDGGRT